MNAERHFRPTWLGRDAFGAAVLSRDGNRCVVCGARGSAAVAGISVVAHPLVHLRLFEEGGWYLENGVALCRDGGAGGCEAKAIGTLLSVDELRARAGIRAALLPAHFEQDEGERYDHWGNPVLPNGSRLRGELFGDPACQQVLAAAGLLAVFAKYVKYPRTLHLPWSPNLQNNDRRIRSLDAFVGQEVVVTEKRDGENTTFYDDHLHARSIDSKDHPSRAIIRQLHGAFAHEVPPGWRICAENLYARHSIAYRNLRAFLEVFGIWDERNVCLGWDETLRCAERIGVGIARGFERGLPVVPVLYRGIWDEAALRALEARIDVEAVEGYVVRVTGPIHAGEWRRKAAKFVRARHVRTNEHWQRTWQPNQLAEPGT